MSVITEPDPDAAAVRYVQAERISTEHSRETAADERVCVVRESPVVIDVDGVESFTILCTPTDTRELAAGFLLTEGLIDSRTDIKVLRACDDDPNTIRIKLAGPLSRTMEAGRNLLIVSSCGACGTEQLSQRIEALPKVGDDFRVEADRIRSVYGAMGTWQSLFEACGGTHAAAVFDVHGAIAACSEDAGRHNALDKAIGKCLLEGKETSGRGVALTSRLSLEMVAKCARAGIEFIAAVSAPTSLAIEVAQTCGVTLCAFVRESRATIFAHPHRVLGPHHD